MKIQYYHCDSCETIVKEPKPEITLRFPSTPDRFDRDLCPDCAEEVHAVAEELL